LRRPEPVALKKGVGSSSKSVARPVREDQGVTRSHMAPGGPCASEGRRDPPRKDDPPKRPTEHEPSPHHLFDGSDHPDVDSLKRLSSKARSTPPVSPAMPPVFKHPVRRGPICACSTLRRRGSRAGL
jgi:hypothetical protein